MKKDEIRRYREKKRARGECEYGGCHEKTTAWRCPLHAGRVAGYKRALYRRKLAAGMCGRCGIVPFRPGRTSCEDCAHQSKLYRAFA